MYLDRANISGPELLWSIPALLAFVVTLLMIGWAWVAFATMRAKVKAEPHLYYAWGPRWNFTFRLLLALGFFAVGWLGYFSIGAVLMLVPPPVSQVSQTASNWVAWLLIGMEAMHALAQGLLWAALRSLAGEPIVPRFWRRAAP